MLDKKLVFMEHDGAIDDLLSQILLLTMPHVEVVGINVTPADCFIEPAIESTYKILDKFGRAHIPIGRNDFNGINAFPSEWRARPEIVNALPDLINVEYSINPYDLPTAFELLERTLESADRPITILMTGPCSNLVQVLKERPTLQNKIERVIWMAGAFRTGGNVQTYQHDGSAEWNVYWDPISAAELFQMELPLVCIPLDVTNHVPVQMEFLSLLATRDKLNLSNLACQFWAMTIDTIPNYYYTYYMWDVLATSFIAMEEHFKTQKVKAKVSIRPPNAGQTILDSEGYELNIATEVDKDAFYSFLYDSLDLAILT